MSLLKINDPQQGMRVAVALSGGVDSAVAAMTLKRQGCDVIGLTLRLLSPSLADSVEDARRVASKIGIPLHVFDLHEMFERDIIGDFIDTYLQGQTPLPCAHCNKKIKFGGLIPFARELGAEALATGHYARVLKGSSGIELHAASDPLRDQSYFLFEADREQLDFLRFPLGDIVDKAETRRMAAAFDLPVAQKPDSQDICFVQNNDYAEFIQRRRPGADVPGDIVDSEGNVLGRHGGIIHFTVGQRRGLDLSDRVGQDNQPLYVMRLDAERNCVVVGPREALMKRNVFLRDVNWLADPIPAEGVRGMVKLRSVQIALPSVFHSDGSVVLDNPAFAIAPGQAAVFYQGTRVMGGGWIRAFIEN